MLTLAEYGEINMQSDISICSKNIYMSRRLRSNILDIYIIERLGYTDICIYKDSEVYKLQDMIHCCIYILLIYILKKVRYVYSDYI